VKCDVPTFALFELTVPEARPVQETKIRAFYLGVLKKRKKEKKKNQLSRANHQKEDINQTAELKSCLNSLPVMITSKS